MLVTMQQLFKNECVHKLKTAPAKDEFTLDDSGCNLSIILGKHEFVFVYKIEDLSDFSIFKQRFPCNDFTLVYTQNYVDFKVILFELKHGNPAENQLKFGKYYFDFFKKILYEHYQIDLNLKDSDFYFFKVKGASKNKQLRNSPRFKSGCEKYIDNSNITIDSNQYTYRTIESGHRLKIRHLTS